MFPRDLEILERTWGSKNKNTSWPDHPESMGDRMDTADDDNVDRRGPWSKSICPFLVLFIFIGNSQ